MRGMRQRICLLRDAFKEAIYERLGEAGEPEN